VLSSEPLYRLTVEQWHQMIASGTLTDDDPVELIEGVMVFKMPRHPPHILATKRLDLLISQLLPDGWSYRRQEPLTLDDSEPEPDGAVVEGSDESFANRLPEGHEIAVVIEVSDATLARDRGMKLRIYARAGIPVYWIVNLIERRIEVYSEPQASLPEPAYAKTRIFAPGEAVEVVLKGQIIGTVAVSAVLPGPPKPD
jgi:Uma2 family endonuclease